MRTLLVVISLFAMVVLGSDAPKSEPRFADGNQLIRPEGYREWIFAGSGLGMGYREESAQKSAHFTNIYIRREAYREFVTTGTFPDKTLLVMEVLTPGRKTSINQRGQFEDCFIGIQAAVKDEQRFPEKWAYFSFIGAGGKPLARAQAFAKEACWQCHHQHGAVDNVFVQFYPVLRNARKKLNAR